MQHSPQEIKTRLGEAVDPEGNVLNMAAVVEVIGLLERTPLTKEALEQTRIGRTVNLLRKKTENEDIARRAKKLVKKWQKLVQNHLEAVRNTNSPLNGLRCNSPVVNGTINDEEKPGGSESTAKPKKIERISKGNKRKRSSSATPPPDGGIENDNNKEKMEENFNENDNSLSLSQESQFDDSGSNAKDGCTDISSIYQTPLAKRLKSMDDDETGCSNNQQAVVSEQLSVEKTLSSPSLSTQENSKTLDHHDVRWETKDFSQQTEDLIESESPEHCQDISHLSLDIEEQVNGVTGYFADDGHWYNWSETMPFNEGNLIVLPYVLLE